MFIKRLKATKILVTLSLFINIIISIYEIKLVTTDYKQ